MPSATPDHLVLAARDLDAAAAWLEDHLGVTLAAGGKHARMGTHNRLLGLGDLLSGTDRNRSAGAAHRAGRAGSGSIASICLSRSAAPDPLGGAQRRSRRVIWRLSP
jgi:catechol 2,3-dioxygenase-like lactoylglutathione lyase family enzyme